MGVGAGGVKAFLVFSEEIYPHWLWLVRNGQVQQAVSHGSLNSEIPISEGDTEVLYTRKGDLVREKSSDSKIS